MGASGTGTTTLARALADHWAVPHADADDYFWVPSTPPYLDKRPEDERLALMRSVFVPRDAWVLSGSMLGWGENIVDECHAVVFLTLDLTSGCAGWNPAKLSGEQVETSMKSHGLRS